MLFCQLARAHSLREICQWLQASEGKLLHLGLSDAPRKSTSSEVSRSTIDRIYRERWQIETFFKSLKQLLKISRSLTNTMTGFSPG